MPYTEDGLKPGIIINPHAIPSRMTIGQLKETILGKVLLELGLFGDGTSFNDFPVKDICKELEKIGYECHGEELLYDGHTGEQIESSIYMGPAFYQRLKHMVNDKQHSRAIGPMVNLTRQPAEGRAEMVVFVLVKWNETVASRTECRDSHKDEFMMLRINTRYMFARSAV